MTLPTHEHTHKVVLGYEDGLPYKVERIELGSEQSMLIALTRCCEASGKGWMDDETGEGMVVCRSCYQEVDPICGAVLTESDIRDSSTVGANA